MDSSSKPTAPSSPTQDEWIASHPGRESFCHLSRNQQLWHKGAEWFAALGGALFVGSFVAAINFSAGLAAALMAGGKQALWTAIMAGLLTRFCRYLCTQSRFRLLPPMACATLGPSLLAIAGVTVLHYVGGTAYPLASIMVTVIFAPPGFWVIAYNMQRAEAAYSQPPASPIH